MSVQFTENNGKKWIFFQGKYLNANEDSKLLLSDKTKKHFKDCVDACAKNSDCQWFSWSTEGGKCNQYKFIENNDSIFQWRYDNYKYHNIELPTEVFNLEHDTETQEQCINDCYNDTNCVAVNYLNSTKKCRIFYNYSNPNVYFGYYVENENGTHQGGEVTSIGDDIYNTKATIESKFGFGTIIGILLAIALVVFLVYMIIQYKKKHDKKDKPLPDTPPELPARV